MAGEKQKPNNSPEQLNLLGMQEDISGPSPRDEHARLKDWYGEGAERVPLTRQQASLARRRVKEGVFDVIKKTREKIGQDVKKDDKRYEQWILKHPGRQQEERP